MKILCLFAQRVCRYEGQYAPELLAAIDEYGNDDNPDYIDEEIVKADLDNTIAFTRLITIDVDDKEFNKVFDPPTPTLTGKVLS